MLERDERDDRQQQQQRYSEPSPVARRDWIVDLAPTASKQANERIHPELVVAINKRAKRAVVGV